ncbi:hypothetical protein [Synechococcus sp. UW179A]|uniref:hypothetical protein n=1 Tax=Synechococcus sp. UW179A TaxID=2575510 RepID=UPI000E0EEADC|nr:hypothetical protein [Synechococcus sp. UW179A]
MAASGRTYHLHHWLQTLLALWIMVVPAATAQAWPWGADGSGDRERSAEIISVASPSGRLQEVSPPGAVQQLQTALSSHSPQLKLISPSDGSVLKNGERQLTLRIEDWPLAEDPQLGLGAHVALQIDDDPPLRFSHADNDRLQITLPDLSPGSHRFSAYAAMPWGEAVKSQGASLQWRLNLLQQLSGTQPDQNDPWLAVVSPSDLSSGDPLLIDWLIWNAPLQNLREGDGRWRLRISVNGDSFLVDRQEALWLKAAGNRNGSVQMELLDGLGDPITPVFNNQLRTTAALAGARAIWMQSSLSDEQMARLLGEVIPEPEQAAEREAAPPQTALTTDSETEAFIQDNPSTETLTAEGQTVDEQTVFGQAMEEQTRASDADGAADLMVDPSRLQIDSSPPAITADDELPVAPDQSAADSEESLETSKAEKAVPEEEIRKTEPAAEPEKLRITSSLGGSARELLNEDGTQR